MPKIREYKYSANDYQAVADLYEAITGNDHHRPKDIQHSAIIPEVFFFALDDGTYVAITCLTHYDEVTYLADLTWAIPNYQGRGIELAPKLKVLMWAKNNATYILDEAIEDDPVYPINLALGFDHLPAWLVFEKQL